MTDEDLLLKLSSLRSLGKITVHFESHNFPLVTEDANLTQVIDGYVASLGFHSINDKWIKISLSDAYNILPYLVTHSIAYGVELRFSKELREIVQEFMSLFSTDYRYFTNGNWHEVINMENNASVVINPSWTPLSESVFDSGLVWINNKLVGIIWIEEND